MAYMSYVWLVIPTITFLGHYLQLRRMLHRTLIAFCKKIVFFSIHHNVTNTLKNVLLLVMDVSTQILFKRQSCFSLVLYSHFVGYHLFHVEHIDSTLDNFLTKIPFGRRNRKSKMKNCALYFCLECYKDSKTVLVFVLPRTVSNFFSCEGENIKFYRRSKKSTENVTKKRVFPILYKFL